MTAREWVPFSSRYGIDDDDRFDDVPGHHRHTNRQEAPHGLMRCDCLGTSGRRCTQALTAEDMLCVECREWCWGVTSAGERVRLARLTAAE